MALGKGNGPGRPRGTTKAKSGEPQAGRGLNIQARYDAAGSGRRMRGWQAPTTGPNVAVQNIQKIRDRSRDAVRNDWAGESSSQKWTTNLIGVGIVPRFKRIKNKARKQAITDLWDDFVAQSDADSVLNFYAQQTLAVASWLDSGEVFIRRRDRRLSRGLPVPMQVQLIEAEMVPMLDADNWPGMQRGHRIRSGIEFDQANQRVAYWMYRDHPGDGHHGSNYGTAITSTNLIRVSADQVRHMYKPNRPGALRGVSQLAPVLARLRSIGDYDDAVLERQKLANLFVAFIKNNLQTGVDTDSDPLTGLPLNGSFSEPLAPLSPGLFQELEPGQEVQFGNPPEAGTTYSDYMRTQHLGTAAAAGIPYEIFSGDIKEISDRTLRVLINEFRRLAEQRQWQIVIPMMCQPVVEWFANAALLKGDITVDEVDAVRRCEHSPHGWEHIHPVQDPQGKKLEVEAGFRSRSSVIASRGNDPDQVDDERAADDARERANELGPWRVLPTPLAAPGSGDGEDDADQDGIPSGEYPAPKKP